jgi:hypothetical protein
MPTPSHSATQLYRLPLRVADMPPWIAEGIDDFTGRFLRPKRQGLSLHHHPGVQATVSPAHFGRQHVTVAWRTRDSSESMF